MLVDADSFERYQIPEIETPRKYIQPMKDFGKEWADRMESVESEVIHSEDRIFDYGKFTDHLDPIPVPRWYYTHSWVMDAQEVVGGLNTVIHDLILMRDRSFLVGKPYAVRYTFCIRSFTNEFFRMKEVFNYYSKGYYKDGIISKEQLEIARQSFYVSFEGMLSLRNRLLHRPTEWTANEYKDLAQLEVLYRQGWTVEHPTKERASVEDLLSSLCDNILDLLSEEGERISDGTSKLIAFFADLE